MSLPERISITDQANMLGQHLSEWAEPLGGKVKIMANMRHLWEEIYQAIGVNNPPRVLVALVRERVRGGEDRRKMTRVDRTWYVVVMRGHGFRNKMAKDDGDGGTDDFYTRCEEVRDRIRVLLSISEEFPVEYIGMEPLPGAAGASNAANVFLDAYRIEFSTANDIGTVLKTNPAAPPP